MRRTSVFISSTYRDLPFERRFVREFLRRRGFDVITMEEQCGPEFDWERWSKNWSGKCDVLVQLLSDRVGTPGTRFILQFSITKIEKDHAQACGAEIIRYELHRPFPDAERLYSPEEGQAYKESLEVKDQIWSDTDAMMIERSFRFATPIHSVGELESHLVNDTHPSLRRLLRYRWRRWSRTYWDTTSAAWLHAFEDESHVASSHRVISKQHIRRGRWVGALTILPAVLLLIWLVPLVWAMVTMVGVALICFLLFIAWAPTYYWEGTKTVVARGFFGMRTLQQPITEPLDMSWSWHFVERILGLSAVTIRFSSGKRIFVPFIEISRPHPFPTSKAQHIPVDAEFKGEDEEL